jgi:two-component system, OmpR family, phosphate regulon sensor histidine kinase PhoR
VKKNKLKLVVMAGVIAFVGIIVLQIYLLRQAFDYEEKKFSQRIQVSLLEVAGEINHYYGYPTPPANPIQKISKDYYIVNIRNDFDAKVLELILTNKFISKGISTNFEYAIYDCETDAMTYGSYVSLGKKDTATREHATYFPKATHLVYYFAVRFPAINSFIAASLNIWIVLSMVMLVALFIYLYAIHIILQQQKFAGLQKDFINNMTHEFKTPLASILIASNFLSKNETIAADEKLHTYSRIITNQGKKLDSHLEKILNIAKLDVNPEALDKISFNMVTVIERTFEIIQLKYPKAIIKVQHQLKDEMIVADEFHFANIVYNFLDNAIKYCDNIPIVDITLTEENNHIRMLIKDNGIGIAPKYQKQIFEKFYRVPGTNKSSVNGFGLGLYYVQKICRLHKWALHIDSAVGKGTTINLIIHRA